MGEKNNSQGKSEKPSGFQISVDPILEGDDPIEIGKKFASSSQGEGLSQVPIGAEAGELPRTYGESSIFLIAQDPHRLFTYWDLDIASHPGGPAVIRCYRLDQNKLEVEFEVPFEARNWYIPVSAAGGTYRVEIGYYRSGEWKTLGMSGKAVTPVAEVSADDSFSYATLPIDAAFSALLASLPPRMRQHPDLMRHLADLQARHVAGNGKTTPVFARENEEAIALLKSILGDHLLLEMLSGSWDTASLSSAIHTRLGEMLSSESASEMLARFQHIASESSLFSGLVVFETLSSETLSSWTESLLSWTHAARHAAASEWLSSWGLRPGEMTAGESSGSAFSSSEAAASWFGLFASSWGGTEQSSWGQAGVTSWAGQTSWSEAAAASWAAAGLGEWSGSALSSWSQAALSSWFGETISSWTAESLSSWTKELLSSWGAAESGSWSVPAGERSFFMHVNAEVIFYGGTDPKARVTIAGQPIQLNPDGTFRYHFVFPNGSYEIPIIAVSPDGVETRSAVLDFSRSTQKVGKVDDTEQPSLGVPPGKKD